MVGTYKINGKVVSESTFRKARGYKSSSSSKRSSKTPQMQSQQVKDTIAKNLYGTSYNNLNAQQQGQVLASQTQAEQRLQTQEKETTEQNIIKSQESVMTESSKQQTPEQKQAEIQARQNLIIKSQKAQAQANAQEQQRQNLIKIEQEKAQVWSLDKARQSVINRQQFQEQLKTQTEQEKQFIFTPYTRYNIAGQPQSVAPKITKQTYERKDEKGNVVITEVITETPPPLTFIDALNVEKTLNAELGINKKRDYKFKFDDFTINKPDTIPQQQLTDLEKQKVKFFSEKETKIGMGNIDEATKIYQTSLYKPLLEQQGSLNPQSNIFKFVNPQTPEQAEIQAQQKILSSKIAKYYTITATKITAMSGLTIITLPLLTPTISTIGATTTGAIALKTGVSIYTASLINRLQSIKTDKQVKVFQKEEGKLLPTINPRIEETGLKGKPIGKGIYALSLTAEVASLAIGSYLAKVKLTNKQIDVTTYKPKPSATALKSTAKGGIKIVETGTIKTKGGETLKVLTTLSAQHSGKGKIDTKIFSIKGGKAKTIYENKAPALIEKLSTYSDSGVKLKVLNLDGTKIIMSSPAKPPKPLDTSVFQKITQDISIVTKPEPLGAPYKQQYKISASYDGGKTYVDVYGDSKIQPTGQNQAFISSSSKIVSQTGKQITTIKITTDKNIFNFKTSEGANIDITTGKPIKPIELKITQTTSKAPARYPLLQSRKATASISPILEQTQPQLFTQTQPLNLNQIVPSSLPLGLVGTTNIPIGTYLPIGLIAPLSTQQTQFKPLTQKLNISRGSSRTTSTSRTIIDTIVTPTPKVDTSTSSQTTTATSTTGTQTPQPPPPVTPIITPPFIPPPVTPIIDIGFDRKPEKQKQQIGIGKGYDVLVRKRGKFVKLNYGGSLTETEALDFGAFKVGTTARATFKLVKSQAQLKPLETKYKGTYRKKMFDFERKGGLFIEKRGKRITTLGEKAEITFKGLKAQKSKKLFKNMWGSL